MRQTVFSILVAVLLSVPPAQATVKNVHAPDGKLYTWYDIGLSEALPGATLADVDSITVRLDGVDLGFTKDDFSAYVCCGGWQGFFLSVPGSPALGEYVFDLTAGERTGGYADTQSVNVTIPLPDESTFAINGDTFSWDAVDLPGTPLYYRLEINHLDGDRIYASGRNPDMLSHTIPHGLLTPGQRYRWRVRITDSSNYIAVQNRSHSNWVEFIYGGGVQWMYVQQRTYESGERFNRLAFAFLDESGGYLGDPSQLGGVRLYGPSGTPVALSALSAESISILFATYSGGAPDWAGAGFTAMSIFSADVETPLQAGVYRLEVTYRGGVYQATYRFNGIVDLPVIPSSSFQFMSDPSGDVTWTWTVPAALCGSGGGADTSVRAIVIISREGGLVGYLYVTVPTCLGSLLIPLAMVNTLNRMGDSFQFIIQLRTKDNNNRTYSQAAVLKRIGDSPAVPARIEGTVTDAASGAGIEGAQLLFQPGGRAVVTGPEGAYAITDLAPGIYDVEISASFYSSRLLSDLTVNAGVTNHLSAQLAPRAPQVTAAVAGPARVFNDGASTTLLSARITHPDGAANITAVTVDLSAVGGSVVQRMLDDGTGGDAAAGDGIYSVTLTVPAGTPARDYALDVEASDGRGFSSFATIWLAVVERSQATVQPAESVSQTFVNALGAQTLSISIVVTPSGRRALRNAAGCYVDLTIYRPDGSVYGTYRVETAVDITIPAAEPGTWRYETVNRCDTQVSYQIETRGSGTGTLAGRVVDAYTGQGVVDAVVTCNTGGSMRSRLQGYFAGVAVAGIGQVVTTKSGYQTRVQTGVAVAAGATTQLDIRLVPETAPLGTVPKGVTIREVLVPADDPKPPEQPLAAKIRNGKLEVNALFPPQPVPVDIFLALTLDFPGFSDRLFLFNPHGALVPFAGHYQAWRQGVQAGQTARVLPPVPLAVLPPADYRFYSLVTPDAAAMTQFDLTYFTKTLGQAPPQGQVVREVESPSDQPVPVGQPLAVRETAGQLRAEVYFPPQQVAVTICIGACAPGAPSRIWFISPEGNLLESSGGLVWWRENVRKKQSRPALAAPAGALPPGTYLFFSLLTSDPVGLSNYELVYFTKKLGG